MQLSFESFQNTSLVFVISFFILSVFFLLRYRISLYKKLTFILSFFLLTSCVSPENPYFAKIRILFMDIYQSGFSSYNIFNLNDEFYVRVLIDEYNCSTCGEKTSKVGKLNISFEFLSEQQPPTASNGRTLEPVLNSSPNITSFDWLLEFRSEKQTDDARFLVKATKPGILKIRVISYDNSFIDYFSNVDIRERV